MSNPHNTEIGVSLTEHPEFLALLQDDQFRQELESRPEETLAKFGIDPEAISLPGSVSLPQKTLPISTGIRSGIGVSSEIGWAGLH